MLNGSTLSFDKCAVMTTKYVKSIAVAPGFSAILGAAVAEYPVDTDALGRFSGNIERPGISTIVNARNAIWVWTC